MKLACAISALLLCIAPAVTAQQPDSIVPPRLLNAGDVKRTLDDAFPPELRRNGVGGVARMKLFISAEGTRDTVRLPVSTGLLSLDAAAYQTAREARFSPATRNGVPVGAWVDLDVRFDGRNHPRNRPSRLTLDRAAVLPKLQSFYPPELIRLQVGARIGVALKVDPSGAVIDHDIVEPSCLNAANDATEELLRALKFDPPAGVHSDPRWTWATVSFRTDTLSLTLHGDTIERDTTASRTQDAPPPVTSAPVLENRGEVGRALVATYPELLRKRGIGGSPVIHFRVEPDGGVSYRMVTKSSGVCELDVAGLNVAYRMRFKPALEDGKPVAVWVQIPIHFRAR